MLQKDLEPKNLNRTREIDKTKHQNELMAKSII